MLLSSSSISLLAFFLLDVGGYASSHIVFKLTALPGRELIQLKFENFATVLVDGVLDNFDDAALLLGGEEADGVFEVSLFFHGHRLVTQNLLLGVVNDIRDLTSSS